MGVKYSEVIERMRESGKLKNDSRVARALGVTPQALSNYKKRGKIPADLVIKFSELFGLYVDWLLSGEGPKYKPGYGDPEEASAVATAREEALSYGNLAKFAALEPEEIICVGKLLKILRSSDSATASALKWTIDAMLKSAVAAELEKDSKKAATETIDAEEGLEEEKK